MALNDAMTVNSESETIRKKSFVAYFNVLYQNLPGRTQKKQE
jgi:hypothetical protein